ncbi:reverse transcriptase domain-containing protein [Rhodococcus sp. AB351]|uniref:reverse transcriptase domain-containing protein n=1 Tax=Rhodococcus sp. AB351 TaxID=3413280 RepID=UPI003C16FB14
MELSVAVGRDGIHPKTLKSNLQIEVDRIKFRMRNGSHRFTPYRQILKVKDANRNPRVLSVPTARDRIVLRALMNTLNATYTLPQQERPHQKVERIRAALDTGDYSECLRIDVVDFYPSISHEILRKELAQRIRKPELLTLVGRALSTPTLPDGHIKSRSPNLNGVPQGLPISNVLAEIFMLSIDEQLAGIAGVSYFRYVDDIVILCQKDQAGNIYARASSLLDEKNMRLHPLDTPGKTSISPLDDEFDFLGYVFKKGKVTVRESSRHRLENSIARVFTRYRYQLKSKSGSSRHDWNRRCTEALEWHLNLLVTGCIHNGRRHGWLHYFSQINDTEMLKKFDLQVDRMIKKYGITGEVMPKRFTSAHWAIRCPSSRRSYIPNFDAIKTDEKRDTLYRIFSVSSRVLRTLTDDEVSHMFSAKINKATTDLEKDIGSVYRK